MQEQVCQPGNIPFLSFLCSAVSLFHSPELLSGPVTLFCFCIFIHLEILSPFHFSTETRQRRQKDRHWSEEMKSSEQWCCSFLHEPSQPSQNKTLKCGKNKSLWYFLWETEYFWQKYLSGAQPSSEHRTNHRCGAWRWMHSAPS